MAHDLAPIDLLYPNGDLPLTLFPDKAEGKTAEDALQLWLDKAQDQLASVPEALHNDAARHWVYAKAYHTQAMRLGTTPNRVGEGGGQMSVTEEWGPDRVQYWEKKGTAEDNAYNALLIVPPQPEAPQAVSGSVRLRAVF